MPPGNAASDAWISMDAALSNQPFGHKLKASAKAAIGDLLCWLVTLDSSTSLRPVLAWPEAPSWETLHPLTGRYIEVSAQASTQNATESADAAARP